MGHENGGWMNSDQRDSVAASAPVVKRAPKPKAFRLPCPHCGQLPDEDGDSGLYVELGNLAVKCSNCDERATREGLCRMMDEAQRLLRWLDMAEKA